MDLKVAFLNLSSLIALMTAIYMIHETNPVRSAFALIGVFLLTAIHWFLSQAEFLAVMLILVYVGAVMVLFLFVIMMIQEPVVKTKKLRIFFFQALISLLTLGCALQIMHPYIADLLKTISPSKSQITFHMLAQTLFSQYLFPFELCGIILLAAMISAVSLTLRGPRNRRAQEIEQQIQAQKKERLILIKDMQP
ncbi:hypothetical protein EBR43_00125 [bacterium]|nr:hypothetical protein [bacterium]NBX72239.1 hypothetical protein [bacterium]